MMLIGTVKISEMATCHLAYYCLKVANWAFLRLVSVAIMSLIVV